MRLTTLCCCLMAANFASLSAQQVTTDTLGITVTRDIIILGDTTFVSINVNVTGQSCDSACRDAAAQRQEDFIRELLEGRDGGSSNVSVVTSAGLTVAAFLIAWYLKGIKDKEHPAHPETSSEPTYGESG